MNGEGPTPADIFFLGEAPSEAESQKNKPLVGPPGEVFDHLLRYAGINRNNVYVSNTVKCRPIDRSVFYRDRDGMVHYGNKTPTILQSYTCGNLWLDKEIQAVKPKVIVTMGNVASEYLLEKYLLLPDGGMKLGKTGNPTTINRVSKITDLLYSHHWSNKYNCYIVPIFHPSYVMRNTDIFSMMVESIKKAEQIAKEGPGKSITKSFIATNFEDVMKIISRASEHKFIAYDLETEGLDWRFGRVLNLGMSWQEGTGATIRFLDNSGAPLFTPEQLKYIKENLRVLIFQNQEKSLIGYHKSFDDSWMEKGLGIKVTAPGHDVQVIYHALNPFATHHHQSLETLCWLYTDMVNFKDETKPWFSKSQFLECPIDVMGRRNCADADGTLRLFHRFYPKLQEKPVYKHYQNFMQYLPNIATTLHLNGCSIDLQKLKDMKTKIEEESQNLLEKFCEDAKVPLFNLRSSKQLSEVLFDKMGLKPVEFTPKGSPSTGESALKQIFKDDIRGTALLEYKKLQKLLGTYVLGLRGSVLFGNSKKRKPDVWTVEDAIKEGYTTDGKAHPSYSVIGTVTGRPSVSRPNVANQPRPTPQQERLGIVIRRAFAPQQGWYILEADQSQCELRVLAALSGDKILTDAINSKEGVHKKTASAIYQIPVEQVTKDQKSQGKTIGFAVLYGGTAYTVDEQISGLLEDELKRRFPEKYIKEKPTKEERMFLAGEFIDTWRAQYPVASQWIEAIKNFTRTNGYIKNAFGKVYDFPLIFSSNRQIQGACERACVNYPIQGSANDVSYMAGLRIQAEIEKRGYQSRWIAFIYDSVVLEVPEDELEEMKVIVKTEMERPVSELPINFVAELEIGKCWKDEVGEGSDANVSEKLAVVSEELPDRYGDDSENEESENFEEVGV